MKKTLMSLGVSLMLVGLVSLGITAWVFAEGNNIINACVAKDGSVRVVAFEEQCKAKETPLSWNRQGEQGPPGVLGFYILEEEMNVIDNLVNVSTRVECESGDVVTGGGFRTAGFRDVKVFRNGPSNTELDPPFEGEAWRVQLILDAFVDENSQTIWTYAICADLTP